MARRSFVFHAERLEFSSSTVQLHARRARRSANPAARRQVSLRGLYVSAHVKRLYGAGEPGRGFAYGTRGLCISVSLPPREIERPVHQNRFLGTSAPASFSGRSECSIKGIHPSPTFISSVRRFTSPLGSVRKPVLTAMSTFGYSCRTTTIKTAQGFPVVKSSPQPARLVLSYSNSLPD